MANNGFDKLLQTVGILANVDDALRIAALSTHAEVDNRVFGQGKNSSDASIGTYSSEPLYVNVGKLPKKQTPKGKTGKF